MAIKDLLGIKAKVSKARLLRISLGTWWECYMNEKHKKILKGLAVEWPTDYCRCKADEPAHPTPKIIPLEACLKYNAKNILKLRMGCLL